MTKTTPMRMILLLAIALGGSGLAVRAQETATKQPRWSFDLTAGLAIPVGQYADLDHRNPNGGPVHTGGLAEVSGTYHLNRSFGVVLLAAGQLNKGNGINYTVPPKPLPPGTLPGDELVETVDGNKHWKIARFMTGGQYTLPLDRKKGIDLLFRLLGGLQKTAPATYNQYFDNNEESLSYPRVNLPWSFSYQFDAGLKWQQTRHIALIAYAGYNGSEPSKALTYLKVSNQGVWTYYPVKATFPTGSLLFRAGISYFLP